ncbi:MAG: ABC transporter permease [Candidatus Cryptobacteroides sp.]
MGVLLVLIRKEFTQIFRNSFIPKLIIVFPIMIMLLMPMIMTMDVKNVNVVVVDQDRSSLSRRIMSHIEASEYLRLAGMTDDFALAMKLTDSGEADAILQIPSDFERNLGTPAAGKISIMANAVNATKASLGLQYVLQTAAGAISGIMSENGMSVNANDFLTVDYRYNPTLDYRHYMIPALMIMLFILVCGFLPALSIVGEKEAGTMEQINVTPVSRLTFIFSKLIPYWLIGLFVLAIAMTTARLVYGLAPVGSIWLILLGAVLFILTISGFSLTVANFSDNSQQAIFVMFFFIMTFILMSGLLTPIDSMPSWAQKITVFLPPRYFVEIMRSVYLKGSTFVDLSLNYLALSIFALAFSLAATLSWRKRS